MPRGDKSSYTSKQRRKAHHIEEGYERRGVGTEEAERRAWATVNKTDRGGKKKSSSRSRSRKSSSASRSRSHSRSRKKSTASSRR